MPPPGPRGPAQLPTVSTVVLTFPAAIPAGGGAAGPHQAPARGLMASAGPARGPAQAGTVMQTLAAPPRVATSWS